MGKTSKVIRCSCDHEFQDERYGKNKRVHNLAPKARNGNPGWRCTVCTDVKSAWEEK